MKYKVIYKKSVSKDWKRFKNKTECEVLKKEVDALLSNNPPVQGKLKGQYEGLYSYHLRYKIMVVYKIFSDSVLVLAVEPREGSYKKKIQLI